MLLKLVEISRNSLNTWPVFVRNSKIMEEVGEFSQALMYKLGFLPHKTMKEPLVGEAADVIITVLDTLSAAYPEHTPEALNRLLLEHLELKSQKWQTILEQRNGIAS